VRRGAAWPAERLSSWLVVREAVSRWQVAHHRAVMVAKRRRRCPQEHGGVAQRTPAGAWWPRCGCRPCLRQRVGVLGQRPESSVWCGCPASRVPVRAAAVRCPVRASERPDVRCPVSSVGVRCPWVPASTVSGREVVEGGGGQAAAWLGWPASAWSLPCPRPVRRLPGRNMAVEAGAGLLGQRRGRLGLGRRRRRWLGSG
jgi:hypothetical protein